MQRLMAESSTIARALQTIGEQMKSAVLSRKTSLANDPRLVAVSKTKPVEAILEAYQAGQRHFGENYVQELVQKASDPQILSSCPDIKWHFIGYLQHKKANKIVPIPNLWIIETIHTTRLAEALNSSFIKLRPSERLNVMLEVNTSREASKHGFLPEDVLSAARHVLEKCPALLFRGLMTIGSVENSVNARPNPDFITLLDCQKTVCQELQLAPAEIELSMGMSEDFEHAIEMGSTEIRVGSKIFGSRKYAASIPPPADEKDGDGSS